MKYFCYLFVAVFILVSGKGEANPTNDSVVEELYISEDFTAEGLFTGGIEGPAVDSKGNLYAVNFQKDGTIGIIDTAGNARIFCALPAGSIGNGIRFDKLDNMYIADYTGHNILLIPAGKSEAEVYLHNASFNQPNDLAIMSNGILFASDPSWSNSKGKLWSIGTDKVAVLLDGNMGTTNGIEVSQDEKRLYVNETVQQKIWKFDLNENGEISNKTLFVSFTDDYGLDGMRCDVDGNLYVTRFGKGTIAIFSPDGILLHEVPLKGSEPSNIAFGGVDGRTCFVTMADRKMIEMFRTETPGREWMLNHGSTDTRSDLGINFRIRIYPNPADTHINLSKLVPDSNITVVDITGRIMARIKNDSEDAFIDVRNWKKGLYFVSVQSGRSAVVSKVVIK